MLRLSKYYSKICLENDLYAIFNRLYLSVLYVTEEKLIEIEEYRVTKKEQNILMNYLIYTTEKMDSDIYNILINILEKENSINCVYIIPSEFCNMSCSYCFVYKKELTYKKKSSMSKDTAKEIIRKITNYLDELSGDKLMIQFYGGEPTLNWKIIEYIVDELNRNDKNSVIEWSIITNGTNLNEKIMRYITEKNIATGISLDGPININNLSRIHSNNDNNYKKIILNLKKLYSYGANIALSFTITEQVLKNKNDILNWIKTLKIPVVNYNMLHFQNCDMDYVKQYYHEATNFIIESYTKLNNKIYEDRINRKIKAFNNRNFKYCDCSAGVGKQVTINSDGDITYCNCDFLDKNKFIKNIKNTELKEILDLSSRKKLWINKLPIYNKKCLECDAIFICGGGCIIQKMF